VQIWCSLASFAQLFLKNAEQADQYLAKTQQILDSRPIENPKTIASVELILGRISQDRGDYKTAIEHMKKAYALYPTRYLKKKHEEASELAKLKDISSGQQVE
jgi:tetratricopeptide (TPR) repeat protein